MSDAKKSDPTMPEALEAASMDVRAQRLDALRALMPEVFSEGKVDFEKLRVALGDAVEASPERYGLTWFGKREAMQAVQVPSVATLVPEREKSLEFDTAQNIIIEGDNLEVLRLLQRSYYGKVKLIYIDPPYNTGKDFVYPDNFRDGLKAYLEVTGQQSEDGVLTSKREEEGRIHSVWLSMMWPRLFLSRNLLSENGVIFVSIDDGELHALICLLDEVFGEENRVGIISWKNVTDNNPTLINKDNEYIVCYARNRARLPQSWKSLESEGKDVLRSEYERLRSFTGDIPTIEAGLKQFIDDNAELVGSLSRYKFADAEDVYTGSESVHNPRAGGYDFEVLHPRTQKPMRKPANGYRFPESTFREMERDGKILYGEDENRIVKIKKYLRDYEDSLRSVISIDGRLGSYDLKRVFGVESNLFSHPKPVALLRSLISFATEKDDLVLDFFGGSGATAEAVLRLNQSDNGKRTCISVQLPEPFPAGSIARQHGYSSIVDLMRARIERVTKEISGEAPQTRLPGLRATNGFRYFRLAESNFRIWRGESMARDPKAVAEQIALFADHTVKGTSDFAVLYEILLKSGFELAVDIAEAKVEGQTVYFIAGGLLAVCLEVPLREETMRAVIARTPKPTRVVVLDRGFRGNDQLKANLTLEFEAHQITFRTV